MWEVCCNSSNSSPDNDLCFPSPQSTSFRNGLHHSALKVYFDIGNETQKLAKGLNSASRCFATVTF